MEPERNTVDLRRNTGDLRTDSGLNDAFRTAFHASPIRLVYCDSDFIIRDINEAFLRHEGFQRAEAIGQSMARVFGPVVENRRVGPLTAALTGETVSSVEWGLRRATRDRLMRITHKPVYDQLGVIAGVLVMMEDTTDLYRLENRIFLQEEVFRQSSEAMAVVGMDYRFMWSNRANAETWGYTAEALVGQHLADVIGADAFAARAVPNLSRVFAGEPVEYAFRHEYDNGDIAFFELSCVPFRDPAGRITGAAVTRRDVTKATLMREELRRQARQDSLTGLANRYALEEELNARIARCAASDADCRDCRSALMLVDLDGFKVVNDLAGHSAGDEVLKQVAGLLRALTGDALIARLGGDEFAIVLESSDKAQVKDLATRIISALESTGFDWDGTRHVIRASVGLAYLDDDIFDAAQPSVYDVINWADRACLLAKEKGGARVSVYHPRDSEILARFQEIGNLRVVQDALDNNRFELFAMPIAPIDAEAGGSYEVLLRVVADDGRLLPPAAFIAAAERHKLMTRVDKWVVTHTLLQMRDIPDEVSLSVNLSGQSVGDTEFRDFLLAVLDEHPQLHQRLAFEITETAAVRSMETARDLIAALKARRCLVILDDFGSGLSSFGYLRHFDVDMLKIDGNIIGDVVNDVVQQTIVAGIVGVAGAMQIRVVAEYVSDQDTLDTLRRLGVSFVQGYHIGAPVAWRSVFGDGASAAVSGPRSASQ